MKNRDYKIIIVVRKMMIFEIVMFFSVSMICVLYDVDKFIAGIYVMLNYLCFSNIYDRVMKKRKICESRGVYEGKCWR